MDLLFHGKLVVFAFNHLDMIFRRLTLLLAHGHFGQAIHVDLLQGVLVAST